MEGTLDPATAGGLPRPAFPSMWRLLAASVLAIVTWLSVGMTVFSTTASAIGNGKFSIAPASSSVEGRTVFTPVLAPGTGARDTVVVVNETSAPLTLHLYASDAYTTSTGGFALQPNFKPKRYMGKWIHLPVTKVTIAPRSGDVIPFTYNPPADAAPGDYAGGIVAEETKSTSSKQKGTVHVRILDAVGVAVYGRIRGRLVPRLAVSDVLVSTSRPFVSQFGGPVDATVTYSVTNTGNENLTPRVTLALSPLIGGASKAQVPLPQILPGSTVTFSHTFDSVTPYGDLTASVTAYRSASRTTSLAAQASGSAGAVVVPWGIVAILVVLALLYVWRRRRGRAKRHKQGQRRIAGTTAPAPVP